MMQDVAHSGLQFVFETFARNLSDTVWIFSAQIVRHYIAVEVKAGGGWGGL